MKDWSVRMIVTDVVWGTCRTALSAWGGVALTRVIFKL